MTKEDNPQFTKAMMKKAKRFHELPENVQKGLLTIKRRGRPPAVAPKKQITFRLQADLVDHLRGRLGYNAKIENVLLKAWQEKRF